MIKGDIKISYSNNHSLIRNNKNHLFWIRLFENDIRESISSQKYRIFNVKMLYVYVFSLGKNFQRNIIWLLSRLLVETEFMFKKMLCIYK